MCQSQIFFYFDTKVLCNELDIAAVSRMQLPRWREKIVILLPPHLVNMREIDQVGAVHLIMLDKIFIFRSKNWNRKTNIWRLILISGYFA